LNQWIENTFWLEKKWQSSDNDMGKRLLEIATLKRMLIPKMGTVDMWILTPSKKNEGFVAQRQPCQMLSFDRYSNHYIGIEQYHKKE
jgi:hypothetical protein